MDRTTSKPTDSWPFVKLFTKGWLTGGIREQLTPAERGVWADLLCMASESRVRGVICRSKGIGYTREALASSLSVPVELLNSTIEKCLLDRNADDEIYRLSLEEDGSIIVGNWDKYQHYDGASKKRLRETSQERELREERIALQWNRTHPETAGARVVKEIKVDSVTGTIISEYVYPEGRGE